MLRHPCILGGQMATRKLNSTKERMSNQVQSWQKAEAHVSNPIQVTPKQGPQVRSVPCATRPPFHSLAIPPATHDESTKGGETLGLILVCLWGLGEGTSGA